MPVNKRRQTLGAVQAKLPIPPSGADPSSRSSAQSSTGSAAGSNSNASRRSRKSMIPRMAGGSENTINLNSKNGGIPSNPVAKTPTRAPRPPAFRKSMGGALATQSNPAGSSHHATVAAASPGIKHRRVSLAPTAHHHQSARSDPRNHKDKAYLQNAIRKMVSYLRNHGYEHADSLSVKNLMNGPSGRDFNNIMTFLLRRVDPTFNQQGLAASNHHHNQRTDESGSVKFEDEVAMAFRCLGYPFPISKTGIVAVGAPHTWPALIAAIDWLIDFLGYQQEEIELNWEDSDEEEESKIQLELMTYQGQEKRAQSQYDKFLRKSMLAFLDDNSEMAEALECELLDQFLVDNERIDAYLNGLDEECERMKEEIEFLNSEARGLSEANQKREEYASDIEKFINLIQQLTDHKADLTSKVDSLTKEKATMEKQMEESSTKIDQLKNTVSSQELSVEDVRKMEREKDRMEEQVAKFNAVLEGHQNALKEAQSKFVGCFQLLEEVVEKYNSKSEHLELIPKSAKHAKEKNFEVVLRKERAMESVVKLMGNVDIGGFVKPSVLKLGEDYEMEAFGEKERMEELKDRIESTENSKDQLIEDIEIIAEKIKICQEECAADQEKLESDISAKRRQLDQLNNKKTSLNDPQGTESTIDKYHRQYEELQGLKKKKDDENVAMMKAVNDEMCKAMEMVQDYQQYKKKVVGEMVVYLEKKGDEKLKLKLLDS